MNGRDQRWIDEDPSRNFPQKIANDSLLERRLLEHSGSLPLEQRVCGKATTITTTDKGVNRRSSKSRQRAVTGRDELSLTQRRGGGCEDDSSELRRKDI